MVADGRKREFISKSKVGELKVNISANRNKIRRSNQKT